MCYLNRIRYLVLGQLPMTEDNSPPNKNKAQPLPTRTTIPRTIPHQDNSPLGPLPRNKTTHQDQNLYGGELSSWGVVRIRRYLYFIKMTIHRWGLNTINIGHVITMQNKYFFSHFLNMIWCKVVLFILSKNYCKYYATVIPSRKAVPYKPRKELFAKWSVACLSHGSYGIYVAITMSTLVLRGLRGPDRKITT